jgi:hypothetical protein
MISNHPSIQSNPNPVEIETPAGALESMLIAYLLEGYHDGCRYLRSAEVNLPVARGIFRADYTFTTREASTVGHFSAFEHVVMFNQLAFVTFAKGFLEGYFRGAPEVSLGDFKALQQYGMFILGMDQFRYLKAFPASEDFPGILTVLDYTYKPEKQLYIAHVHSDFGEGRALGDFTVGLKRRSSEGEHRERMMAVA